MKKSSKIAIVVTIVAVLAIIAVVAIFMNKGKETEGGNKKDPLQDMVKMEVERYFKANEKDFKEIQYADCKTIEEDGNIVTVYGNAGYTNVYGNGSYSVFEGIFEKTLDSEGKLLNITTKYLKYGPTVYVDNR